MVSAQSRRTYALATLIAVLVVVGAVLARSSWRASASPSGKELRVGLPRTCGAGLLAVAQTQGLFAARGSDVELLEFASGKQSLTALLERQVDVAVTGDLPLAAAIADGADVQVLAVLSRETFDRWIVARPSLPTVAALRGKRVALQRGTRAEYILDAALAKAGLASGDVELVPTPAGELPAAVASGRADAFVPEYSFVGSARDAFHEDLVALPTAGAYELRFVLVTRRDFAAGAARDLTAMLRALAGAEDAVHSAPAAAASAVARRLLLDPDKTGADCEAHPAGLVLDAAFAETLAAEERWFEQHHASSHAPRDVREILLPEPLAMARPTAVTLR